MKLMSYVNDGLSWGIVIDDAVSGRQFVIDPQRTQKFLDEFCSDRTVGYFLNRPSFFPDSIPATMTDFLTSGEVGMTAAREMKTFVERFISQSDRTLLSRAAHPIDDVEFLPPIPEPRLLWGLVGNVPSFSRSKLEMKQLQLIPQGHQRPPGTVIAHKQSCRLYRESGGNAELAIVIGRQGRNIRIQDAMSHVAGYTIVNDMCHSLYGQLIMTLKEKYGTGVNRDEMNRIARERGSFFADEDIYAILSSSWAGKMSDRMCAIGPWIVTPDEIGDPYDLLVYTRRDGQLLGRGHTCALLVGIERAIAYYSSFATLYPGDIIHFGAVSKDGYSFAGLPNATTGYMQSEIEKIGTLSVNAQLIDRAEEAAMPATLRAEDRVDEISSPIKLCSMKQRNLYNIFGNTTRAWDGRRLEPKPFPRFLCVPGTVVSTAVSPLSLSSASLRVSAEFCAVIGSVSRGLKPEDVVAHLAGVCPMLCVEDYSLTEQFAQAIPAFDREWALPEIYGRWGDGFNTIPDTFMSSEQLKRVNRLHLDVGNQREHYDTSDYMLWFDEVIAFITSYITLYPGDIVTLGNLGPSLDISETLRKTGAATIHLESNVGSIVRHLVLSVND